LGVVDRDLGNEGGVQRMLIDMSLERQPVFLRQRARQPLRLQRAHLDQHVGQLLTGLLALARLVEVLLRHPRAVKQDCLETLASGRHQADPPTGVRPLRFKPYPVIFESSTTTDRTTIPPVPAQLDTMVAAGFKYAFPLGPRLVFRASLRSIMHGSGRRLCTVPYR